MFQPWRQEVEEAKEVEDTSPRLVLRCLMLFEGSDCTAKSDEVHSTWTYVWKPDSWRASTPNLRQARLTGLSSESAFLVAHLLFLGV
jgi:hypothetical protein